MEEKKEKLISQLLTSYIAKGKTLEALEIMMKNNNFFDGFEVSNFSSRWVNLMNDKNRGVIDPYHATIIENQINHAIISFLRGNPPKDNATSTSNESKNKKLGKILLTSTSPRRIEILEQLGWTLGIEFFVYPVHHQDNVKAGNIQLSEAKVIAKNNAKEKIRKLLNEPAERNPFTKFNIRANDTIVIGVDTLVFCAGRIIDRPLLTSLAAAAESDITNAKESAYEMLIHQSGKEVIVLTSICAVRGNNIDSIVEETIETTVRMRNYSEEEIHSYIETFEPIDKAGAFGIQGKGISLIKNISGDYYNVVGLPLVALEKITKNKMFSDLFFDFYNTGKFNINHNIVNQVPNELTAFSMGDINYDFVYDKLPDTFFNSVSSPTKIQGPIFRGVGGTAIQFAKGAKKSGFKNILIVGVYGNDELGKQIDQELYREGFIPLLGVQYRQEKTSIAIIIRETDSKDISLTITDSIQSLPPLSFASLVQSISISDVIYCSGYCIIDNNRRFSAQSILKEARNQRKIVVLDIVKDMDKYITYKDIKEQILITNNKNFGFRESTVDVLVSEFREIFRWLNIDEPEKDEMRLWVENKDYIVKELKPLFRFITLRFSDYAKEVIIKNNFNTEIIMNELDYPQLPPRERLGYSDKLTAQYISDFLSPRILLASASTQRHKLLMQIMASNKIICRPANCNEEINENEDIFERVQRLALEKAETSLSANKVHTIEFVIGADTEIGIRNNNGKWDIIPHPRTDEEAFGCLKKLSGQVHSAITGIAIIYWNTKTNKIDKIKSFLETKVEFFELDDKEIEAYVKTKEPIDRAGGYAIQGKGALLVKRIDGSFSNIVGLPLELLLSMFKEIAGKGILGFDEVSNWSFINSINVNKHASK